MSQEESNTTTTNKPQPSKTEDEQENQELSDERYHELMKTVDKDAKTLIAKGGRPTPNNRDGLIPIVTGSGKNTKSKGFGLKYSEELLAALKRYRKEKYEDKRRGGKKESDPPSESNNPPGGGNKSLSAQMFDQRVKGSGASSQAVSRTVHLMDWEYGLVLELGKWLKNKFSGDVQLTEEHYRKDPVEVVNEYTDIIEKCIEVKENAKLLAEMEAKIMYARDWINWAQAKIISYDRTLTVVSKEMCAPCYKKIMLNLGFQAILEKPQIVGEPNQEVKEES